MHLRESLAPRYQVEAEIGRGASATVYRAFDQKLGRPVAIKLLRTDLLSSTARERFLREIEIAAQLQHPHIVPMLDSGEALGSVYFVMPVLEGETLRARLTREGRLSSPDAVRIVLDLADALSHAHRHGVVHRDIKPENIMLSGRHAVIMDFGVAKALGDPGQAGLTGALALGTPAYMAPEQAMADPTTDHRADLYALGIVAYEMLAGGPPFIGASPQDVLTAHLVLTPEPLQSRVPNLPEPVAAVVDRCLAKNPADRWQTADDIIAGLEAFATLSGATPPPRRRPRWVPWIAAAVALGAVAAATWDLSRRSRPTPSLPAAERISFLGTVKEAALAPDGMFLAYVTADAEGQRLMVEDTRTNGRAVEVAQSERIVGISWINDGVALSFAEGPAESPVTRMVPRLGGSATAVGRGRGLVAPTGDRVVIATGGDPTLIVLTPGTPDTVRLRRPGDGWMSGVAWSPTADRLALTVVSADKRTADLWTLGLDGTATARYHASSPLTAPTWTPDGEALLVLSGPTSGTDRELWRVPLSGRGQPSRLATGLAVPDEPRREPTGTVLSLGDRGRRLVFVREERWTNLARFRLDSRGDQPLEPRLFTMGTAVYASPRLSPDGRQVAVYVSTPRGTALATVPAEGNTLTELALVEAGAGIAWRPDGRAVAAVTRVADSGLRLTIHPLDGVAAAGPFSDVGQDLAWGTGGIVAQRPGNRGFVMIDPDHPNVVRRIPADTSLTTYSPRLAPDGRTVAALTYDGTKGPVTVSLIATADGSVKTLANGAYRPLGWSRDGAMVYLVRNSFAPVPEMIAAVSVRGGPLRALATLPPGYLAEDLSADASLLIATQIQTRGDIHRIALP